MATIAHAQAVKSLNNSSGRQRFVFKTFSQRIEDVDIDVYRSLDKVKSEPSEGTSFFKDCLIEYRELNTAEDFITFYEEMIPFVQTLPLVILHKDTILSKLLSRLNIKARLSLEPILRLLAALSRDLLEEFSLYLSKIADSLVSLLESGADKEPEIIEQIFMSWSYIMMYLQKYLTDKLADVLRMTVKLRYYPKQYIQDFMAESVSFLLRNASFDQLEKGVFVILDEVVTEPLVAREYGVSTLLTWVMKGTSSKIHSKGERVLKFLMSDSVLGLGVNLSQGSSTVVDVLTLTFQELSKIIDPKELNVMWRCFYQEITVSIEKKQFQRLSHLLSLLISMVEVSGGRKGCDYRSMVDVTIPLLQTLIDITSTEDNLPEYFYKVLQLMLCTLDVLHNNGDTQTISCCSSQWAPVFELKSLSLLNFVGKLLLKDLSILNFFRTYILSAMSELIDTSPEEVVHLLHTLFEKNSIKEKNLDGLSRKRILTFQGFLRNGVQKWIDEINVSRGLSSAKVHGTNFALLWGTVGCVPFLLDTKEGSSLLTDLIDAIDWLLTVESEAITGTARTIWQSIIGAALSAYSKLDCDSNRRFDETSKFLHLARRHKLSFQILSAVADFLDCTYGPNMEADCSSQTYHPELIKEKTLEALSLFSDNLRHSEKGLRIAALRILSHYEPLICDSSTENQPALKKMRTQGSQTSHSESLNINVLQLLYSIETTSLSISTSRRLTLVISRLHMAFSSGRMAEAYVPLLLNALVGIFYNRFSPLWDPASECLSAIVSRHMTSLWEKVVSYFGEIQSRFYPSTGQLDEVNYVCSEESNGLFERFNLFTSPVSDATPWTTVLSLLLQSLQRIPEVVESQSRCIVPLFFKFLGYSCDKPTKVGSFSSLVCRGKEWKNILKEWLNLLKLMRNLRSFHQNQFLKDVLEYRLLDANDPEVQIKVLDCLLIWNDKFLATYDQHLKKLISFNSFREELTRWSLSSQSKLIEEPHRANLVPIVIRILMPKVRKLKKHSSRKHASVNYRKAVLAFIAELDVDEVPVFFVLLMKPLQIVLEESDATSDWLWAPPRSSIENFQSSDFLKYFTCDNITDLSWKKRSGFLHVINDLLGVFDELHIKPFLKFIVGCIVRILWSCCHTLDAGKDNGYSVESKHVRCPTLVGKSNAQDNIVQSFVPLKQSKELRSRCLKILSSVLNKYEDHDFGDEFWDLFFKSVKPLIDSFTQEASSSENPSSLFTCFVAMSRSPKLVPLLYREKGLVPAIFEILTVSSAAESIFRCVLKFIENLLTVDSKLDTEDSDIKRVLLPNLETLINSLHGFFKSESATKRKLVKCPGESERRVFMLLSKYVKDPLSARKFMDFMLPFLTKGAQSSDVCREAVQIIQGIIPVLGSEITTTILNAISPLFVSADRNMRVFLCDLLENVAQVDPSIHNVATIVRDLNATSAMEMGGLDYDTIINAYEKINADFFFSVDENQTLVMLSHCVFDMSSEDLILRQCAYRLLMSFVESAAVQLTDMKGNSQLLSTRTTDTGCWSRESIRRIISKHLLKHLGSAMNRGDSVKREWINLLRDMVLKIPNVENLNYLKPLWDEDVEKDFFNNIIHLQRHRRARALLRFKSFISSCFMAERVINKVFLPLFFNMLFQVHEGKGKGEHLINACIEAISSISSKMRWDSYFSLLMRCFNEMSSNPDKQKILLRLICSVLDQFHFSVVSDSCLSASASRTNASNSSAILGKCSGTAMLTEIQFSLQKALLPKIQKILDADDTINVNISLAALKVLKLLPGDVMDSQLPTIIHRISNFLKNRLESIRDEARFALAACLKVLGIEYLQFIVKILRTTLKRGYEMHVLGYTLNYILSNLLSTPVSGNLDYCLNDLLAIVENDILGDVGDEKEVDKIASKMKETRKPKSFETLKLITQTITFKTHVSKVLTLVTSQLQKSLKPKVKTKLESMLSHIAAGIECNSSADQTELFIFIFGLIDDGIKGQSKLEKISNTGTDGYHRKVVGGENTTSLRVKGDKTQCSNLIMVFALGILHKRIKTVGKNDLHVIEKLDPFVPLLVICLNSRYEDVLSASFRCITRLLEFPLPSIESHVDKIKGSLFAIVSSSVDASSSLVQSCLKLLTGILKGTKATLSSEELHLLIQLPVFVELERNPYFVSLPLLKEVVKRKLVVPEIYDLVTRVARLMITSQEAKIRAECSKILLPFLLDYRLSEKRLHQHLNLLLTDLQSYKHAEGRKSVLEMLHAIIVRFPRSILDDQSLALFIYLVVCLSNDEDKEVRSMSGAAIKLLVHHISASSTQAILECSISWYLDSQSQNWSVAAQVLGLLVQEEKKAFQRHICRVLPRARSICMSAVKDVTDETQKNPEESTIPFWKQAYYSLIMLEKILNEFGDLFFKQDLEEIWGAICELLLHPHVWLRDASNRLVALYFSAAREASKRYKGTSFPSHFLTRPNRLFMIAVSLCCRLKEKFIDKTTSDVVVRNLVFTLHGLHLLMRQLKCGKPDMYLSTLEQNEQGHFLEAVKLLDSGKGQRNLLSLISGEVDKKDDGRPNNIGHLLVSNLVKRMGKIALQMDDVQMKIVLSCFSDFCTLIAEEDRLLYAYDILVPLYKICEGFAGKVISDEMKQFAQEINDRLRNIFGIQAFVQVYSEIRKSVKAKRDKRRQEEKIMAVVNPMRNAKRKLRVAAKHRANKKRKIMKMKFGRWM